jgi:hypothetical protein
MQYRSVASAAGRSLFGLLLVLLLSAAASADAAGLPRRLQQPMGWSGPATAVSGVSGSTFAYSGVVGMPGAQGYVVRPPGFFVPGGWGYGGGSWGFGRGFGKR